MNFFYKQRQNVVIVVSLFCATAGFCTLGRAFRIVRPLQELFHAGTYARKTLISNNKIKKVLFSPDDQIKRTLIGLIDEEQAYIKMAAFSLTDKEIAAALIRAHERKVSIELVVDGQQSRTLYSKVFSLVKRGIVTYSYEPQVINKDDRDWTSLMHNKFIVFGKSLLLDKVISTGSFNFTNTAANYNQENVLIQNDQEIAQVYLNQFEVLKKRCCRVSPESAHA